MRVEEGLRQCCSTGRGCLLSQALDSFQNALGGVLQNDLTEFQFCLMAAPRVMRTQTKKVGGSVGASDKQEERSVRTEVDRNVSSADC